MHDPFAIVLLSFYIQHVVHCNYICVIYHIVSAYKVCNNDVINSMEFHFQILFITKLNFSYPNCNVWEQAVYSSFRLRLQYLTAVAIYSQHKQ